MSIHPLLIRAQPLTRFELPLGNARLVAPKATTTQMTWRATWPERSRADYGIRRNVKLHLNMPHDWAAGGSRPAKSEQAGDLPHRQSDKPEGPLQWEPWPIGWRKGAETRRHAKIFLFLRSAWEQIVSTLCVASGRGRGASGGTSPRGA